MVSHLIASLTAVPSLLLSPQTKLFRYSRVRSEKRHGRIRKRTTIMFNAKRNNIKVNENPEFDPLENDTFMYAVVMSR
jgi:hypothetical protein